MQAVILAGGKGTRLQSRLGGLPKPLVDVDGTPLLQRQIECLRTQQITDVVVLVSYRADAIRAFCAAHDNFGIKVTIIDEGEPLGTAGAVLAVLDQLQEKFLVIYGDLLVDADFAPMIAAHKQNKADGTLFLHPNDHPFDSDLVELDSGGRVIRFLPYPRPPEEFHRNLVNAAVYLLERDALRDFVDIQKPSDFGKNLFAEMIRAGKRLLGYVSFEYIKDIGTPDRLDKAVRDLRSGRVERGRLSSLQQVVFLDRDGTLNEEVDHLHDHRLLSLLPGAGAAIRRLNEAQYRCIVITNQPVLARGECSLHEMDLIHAKLESDLGRDRAFLDRIFMCPHHPDSGFAGEIPELKRACNCRKPELGLIEDAEKIMRIDRKNSWFVGDSTTDIETARRAGLRSILLRTGKGGMDGKFDVRADFTAEGLPQAVDIIVSNF
ncbi:HAD-IIIA family hydrolase [Bradyrhizobium manausense]|uniref:HAD-IIIA family hydrolase n=1 Tax=Bradyrhizobium manausense TaxID=989370 RepID=UPI001BABDAEC|nr:HAD-IIIA family hydrolase [Bradyrhizobium manausense]MBR1092278.1 HAD-IIIA family hydrolase [Bradyrhizobium manausense]